MKRIVLAILFVCVLSPLSTYAADPHWVPLYRYYKHSITNHFYVTTPEQRAGAEAGGYSYEGIQCYVAAGPFTGGTAVYRWWNNSIGDHFYTSSPAEAPLGYESEGICFYVASGQIGDLVPLYRLWKGEPASDHFYVTTPEQVEAAEAAGYVSEGTLGYVSNGLNSPTVEITSPTSSSSYSTSNSSVSIGGTCEDMDGDLSRAELYNSANGSSSDDYGPDGYTSDFSFSGVSLETGDNDITITVFDDGDRTATDQIVITYNPPVDRIIRLSGDLAFGSVEVGQTAQRTLTIHSDGNSPLTVSGISYPSGFSGSWSGAVPVGGRQDVTVTFAPTEERSYTGSLTVNSDKTEGTRTKSVSGTGTAVPTRIIRLSDELAFGSVEVGQTAQRTLTIHNDGNSPLTVSGISYPAGFSGDWSGTVPVGGRQDVTVTFAPTEERSYSDDLTVNSDKTEGVNTKSVSGTGTAARIIRLSGDLAFGSVEVGQTAQRTLTVHNDGNSPLTVSGISYPEGFSGSWSGAVPAGGHQDVTVTFAPTEERSYSGSLMVNSDRTDSIHTKSVSGAGIQVDRYARSFAMPVPEEGWYDAQNFGAISHRPEHHLGEDWNKKGGGDSGLPVFAIANGTVSYVNDTNKNDGWGKTVIITHESEPGSSFMTSSGESITSINSMYAHLSEIKIVKDDGEEISVDDIEADKTYVEKGWQIGKVGNGNNPKMSPHLHFEIRTDDALSKTRSSGYSNSLAGRTDPSEFIQNNRSSNADRDIWIVTHTYDSGPNSRFVVGDHSIWGKETGESYSTSIGHNDLFYSASTSQNSWIKWHFKIPRSGRYNVQVFVPRVKATTSNAIYKIHHNGFDKYSAKVNQNGTFDGWVSLGTYYFNSGYDNFVELWSGTDEDPSVLIAADAVMLESDFGQGGGESFSAFQIDNFSCMDDLTTDLSATMMWSVPNGNLYEEDEVYFKVKYSSENPVDHGSVLRWWEDAQDSLLFIVPNAKNRIYMHELSGLTADTYYYAAICNSRYLPVWSDISNVAEFQTKSELDVAPTADFTATPAYGIRPLTAQFTDNSVGAITSWQWDFGDGETSEAADPEHTYRDAGNYAVTLTVVGPGGSHTASDNIRVEAPLDARGEEIVGLFGDDISVGLDDFLLLVGMYGKTPAAEGFEPEYDLDRDGSVGLGDFLIFVANFGKVVANYGSP